MALGSGNALGLLFKISTGGTATETEAEITSLRTTFNREVSAIRNSGRDAFLDIGNSAGFSTSQLAGLSFILPTVGAGIAALAGGVIAAGVALFELTKKTADFGEQVWRTHEKTGLTVETISALKVAGDEFGISISTMSTGLVRFTNNLAMAQAGNKKFIDEFHQLGITAFKDNDQALSQFLERFATLRTDQERTLAASQAFGVRMGASFVEMFNRIGGDMAKFKDELRDLGLLMDTEQAKESHDFTEMYKLISQQFNGLMRQIGFEVMPTFMNLFTDTSKGLAENRAAWKAWGQNVNDVLLSVLTTLGGVLNVLKNLSWKNLLPLYGPYKAISEFFSGMDTTADRLMRQDQTGIDVEDALPGFMRRKSDFELPEKKAKVKKDQQPKRDFEAELSEIRSAISGRESAYAEETANIKSQYDQQLVAFDEKIAAEKEAADKRLLGVHQAGQKEVKGALDLLNDELAALDDVYAKKLIKEDEYNRKRTDIRTRETVAVNNRLKEEERLDAASYKHQETLLAQHNAAVESLNQQRDSDAISDLGTVRGIQIQNAEWQIGNATQLAERKLAIETQYNDEVQKVQLDALDRKEKNLTSEINAIALHYAESHKITIEEAFDSQVVIDAGKERAEKIIAFEYERARIIKETSDRNIQAYRDEAKAAVDAANLPAQGATRPRQFSKTYQQLDFFTEFGKVAKNVFGATTAQAKAMGQALETVFSGVAQAVGDAVKSFVLYGTAGGGFRKIAAEIIASVAAQAAAQAVYYGALALAWEALFLFTGNVQYQAAAIEAGQAALAFGLVAAVTIPLGRLLAGNQFSSSATASGGSGGSGGGSSSGSSSQGSSPIVLGSQRQAMEITVQHTYTNRGTIDSHIKSVILRDLGSGNGEIRHAIVKEIGRP